MKLFILKGLLAVLILGGAAEATARWGLPLLFGTGLAELEDYYRPVQATAERGPITHLFVGSSQVAAAIDADTLQRYLRVKASPDAPERIRVVNAGKGYSQQAQHYLAVRNLIEAYPESTRGMTVFLEAPGGVADYRTWDGNWTLPKWPSLLGPIIQTRDLPRFWLHADNTFGDKVRVTATHFFHTPRYYRHVRLRIERTVNRALLPPPEEEEDFDLTDAGGIRTDKAGVEATRREAMRQRNDRWVEQHGEGGRVASDWEENAIWGDLIRLVQGHGGQVVFFDMPQSPVMDAGERDAVFEERQDAFEAWARSKGTPILFTPEFVSGVEDFPDNLHLRNSRSPEFTTRLAEAYLEWERTGRLPERPADRDVPADAPAEPVSATEPVPAP